MRLRFSDNADSGSHAFTLVELLAVVAVMTLVAGVLASSMMSGNDARRARSALRELDGTLSTVRIHAMRAQIGTSCVVRIDEDRLTALSPNRDARTWSSAGLRFATGPEDHTVRFGPDGRASERAWRFVSSGTPSRVWIIEFHPLSGSPRVSAENKDQST